jgi:hypothetical protein
VRISTESSKRFCKFFFYSASELDGRVCQNNRKEKILLVGEES